MEKLSAENKLRINITVVVFIVLGVIAWIGFGVHTVTRDGPYLQKITDDALAKKRTVHTVAGDITINSATISLADNKATITVDVSGRKLNRDFQIITQAIGVPDYRSSKSGVVYFKPENVEVTHFSYDKKPPSAVTTALASRFTSVQNAIDKRDAKVEEWISQVAERAATDWLKRMPVYKLNEDTNIGFYAHAALLDHGVNVIGDKLTLKFSLWKFSMMVIGGIVLVIVLIGIAIVAPEGLLIFALFS